MLQNILTKALIIFKSFKFLHMFHESEIERDRERKISLQSEHNVYDIILYSRSNTRFLTLKYTPDLATTVGKK